MNSFLLKIADILDNLYVIIRLKQDESTSYCMTRKELIQTLEQRQLEIAELKQTNQDLMSAIVQYIDDLHEVNDGNLSIRLKVGGCVFGHLADCVNSVVEDLEEAVKALPVTHPLKEKYFSDLKKNK